MGGRCGGWCRSCCSCRGRCCPRCCRCLAFRIRIRTGIPRYRIPRCNLRCTTVTEVEVPQYKFVPQEKVVELRPACQNAWGFGVPVLELGPEYHCQTVCLLVC